MRSLLCASRNNDLLRFEFLSSHLAGFRPAGSHCEKSGKSDDTCASARSGCAKQRNLLCPLSGTPVDCVKVAFDYLLRERKVDLVLSGINHGSNSAVALLYSGTMGAAIEGSFYDCPSIGLSLTDHRPDADFTAARIWGERIVRDVLEHPAPLPLCLNVNIPAGAPETIRGIRVCRQAQGLWREQFVCRQDPHGRDYLWLTGEFVNDEHGAEETDEWALTHGYVSVQPVQADQTDYRRMEEMRRLFDR